MNHPEPHVISVVLVALPLLTVLLSIPMILGWVKPNPWYGVRTRKTLGSPQIWYRANRVGGIYLTIATLAALAVWAVLASVPLPEPLRPVVYLAVLAASMLAGSVAALARVQKM
jgi:uncharacterized membrane protein